MHANKRPKHGGFVFDGHKFWHEMIKGLMPSYFVENRTFLESYFHHHFWMDINLLKHIAES
jgi:hypothetical protein